MDQLILTSKRGFFQAMYQEFCRRTEAAPPVYRDIFQYQAEEKVREYTPTVNWFA